MYTYINKNCTIIFEQKLNTLMTNEIIEEVKSFYENLDENSKKDVKFQIYRKCKSIEDEGNCMIWLNISFNKFIMDFCVWNEKKCKKIKDIVFFKQKAAKELNYLYEIWIYDNKGNKVEFYN